MGAREQAGRYIMFRPSFERQIAIDALGAMPPSHLMYGLLEFDVTRAIQVVEQLRVQGDHVSLFAFILRCIAVAISEHPDMNLVRHGGRKLVRFEDVDIAVPVEVVTAEGRFPRERVVRGAQRLSAQEIYADLEAAKALHRRMGDVGEEDRRLRGMMRALHFVPRFIRLAAMRWFMRSAFSIKEMAGTTLVTSVGKFASIPGFGFSFTTGPRAAAFAVGGVVKKPWVYQDRLELRSVLSLSMMLNHDLVDGAPAARFAARLQELVEQMPTPPSLGAFVAAYSNDQHEES
jgi:hypothetical protein